jgi:hypothetical protein
MKKITLIIFLLIFVSCKNDEETNVMYENLLNYRNELKFYVKDVGNYLSNQSEENSFFKRRFDSLNKIQKSFEHQFEKNKYGNRTLLIKIRDEFNEKQNLGLKFNKSNYGENIRDTIFNRIMEIDILRLQKEFQNRKMMIHGCKFDNEKN